MCERERKREREKEREKERETQRERERARARERETSAGARALKGGAERRGNPPRMVQLQIHARRNQVRDVKISLAWRLLELWVVSMRWCHARNLEGVANREGWHIHPE